MVLYAVAKTREDAVKASTPTFVKPDDALEFAKKIGYGVYQVEDHPGNTARQILETRLEPLEPEDDNSEMTLARATIAVDRLNDALWHGDHSSLAGNDYDISPNNFLFTLGMVSTEEYYVQLMGVTIWDSDNDTRLESDEEDIYEPLELTLLRESRSIFRNIGALFDVYRSEIRMLEQKYDTNKDA